MMVVEEGEVLLDLRRIIADTVVGNNEIRLCKIVDPSTNRITITSSIIVLKYLTSVQVLRNKAVDDRRIKAVCFDVIG